MVTAGKKNAIELRLDILSDQWTEFAQADEARVLRWLAEPDERRLIEALIELENDPRMAGSPDLFIRFDTPFAQPEEYGFALSASLRDQYEAARADLNDPDPWVCPSFGEQATDAGAFLEVAASFAHHHEERLEHLALILLPRSISDRTQWAAWISRYLETQPPGELRLVVLDDPAEPQLEAVATAHAGRIWTTAADLDMRGAYRELSRAAGHIEEPGGKFRELFLELMTALGSGELASAETAGAAALDLAHGSGWPHLEVAVLFALGGGYLGAGRNDAALDHYSSAERIAAAAEAGCDSLAGGLRVKSLLAMGAALVAAADFRKAAEVYESAAELSRVQGDSLSELESWRMASYCRDQTREYEAAWTTGQEALSAGESLEPEMRRRSTLPFLGRALLELGERCRAREECEQLEQRLRAALGPEAWPPRDQTPAEAQA